MTQAAYREHPLRESVARILEMRKAPEFAAKEVAENEAYTFARDKVFAISQCLNDLLQQTPAELTNTNTLNQLHSNIQAPINELTAYIGNRNPGHISNAASQMEQNILPFFWAFAPNVYSTSGSTFPELLDSLGASTREAIKQIGLQRDDLLTRIQEAESRASSLSSKLDEVITGAAKERAEAVATVAKLEQQFSQNEGARQQAFDAAQTEFNKLFKEFSAKAEKDTGDLLTKIEEKRKDAARIVQIVGNIGVTGNYQKIAEAESKQANLWRRVTVGAFCVGVSVALVTFITHLGQPLTSDVMRSILIRLLYAIAITAPAWYTARESARHRTNADRARQTELELASLGPFLDLLPEEKKVEIREKLAPMYFGRSVEAHTVEHPLDPVLIKDTAVEVAKALRK